MKYIKTAIYYSIAILFVWLPFVFWFKDNFGELISEYKTWFKTAKDLSNK